jgi:glycosyltransferase involved in cell wall biosynthesis
LEKRKIKNASKMNIILSLTNMEMGGAQLYTILLANEFQKKGHNVAIFVHQPDYIDYSLKKYVNKNIVIQTWCTNNVVRFFVWKINGFLKKILNCSIIEYLNERKFINFIEKFHPDIINSQMSYSDYLISKYIKKIKNKSFRFIVSTHGEYELNVVDSNKALEVIKVCDGIIGGASKNLYYIKGNFNVQKKIMKIIRVGFSDQLKPVNNFNKPDLNIPDNDIVIGMVARGIPEKGWEELIIAFHKYNTLYNNSTLLLIGKSQYLSDTVKKYFHPKITHLSLNNSMEFLKYLNIIDIGVLPTYFSGESFPNILVQYVFYQIPSIATDIGDIKEIINIKNNECGILLKLNEDRKISNEDILKALIYLTENKEYYNYLKNNCKKVKNLFEIKNVAEEYISFYERVISNG